MTTETPRPLPRAGRLGRAVTAVSAVLALALSLALVPSVVPATTAPAQAADLSSFDPGNIISDAVFFNGYDMTAPDLQAFLAAKGASCTPSRAGIPCLKDFRQNTVNRPADTRCTNGYRGASNESAADIITKVAQGCGVSVRALTVMLQKEQGLVLAKGESLTARKYQIAMGYGCPDTAPCDADFYGFFNQVYKAAWQLKSYAVNPKGFNHKAGAWNNVRFHPNAACGSSAVYIANQATASLYNYTPYQPNAAALRAGYGTGDGCSSYGNRNFAAYFQDWFSQSSFVTVGAIDTWYRNGGAAVVGPPTANQSVIAGGFQQSFARGTVSSSSAGTFASVGVINREYLARKAAWGQLGLATGPEKSVNGGYTQEFQNGTGYLSASTPFSVARGEVRATYLRNGGAGGSLGWPSGDEACVGQTCAQDFRRANGSLVTITWSAPYGAQLVSNAIRTAWLAGGGLAKVGPLKSSEVATADKGGSQARFQIGNRESIIVWTSKAGARAFGGGFLSLWDKSGGILGMGYPLGDEVVSADKVGTQIEFERTGRRSTIMWSPATGTRVFGGSFLARWKADGGVYGLGYPITDEAAVKGTTGTSVEFLRNGRRSNVMWTSGTGVHAFGGVVREAWLRNGGATGMGFPIIDETKTADGAGATAVFRNATGREIVVLWSGATGGHVVGGPVRNAWNRSGGVFGLGYPTIDEAQVGDGVGSYATFKNGSLDGIALWSPATDARFLSGPAYATWQANGKTGTLGYPTRDESYLGVGVSTYVPFTSGSWIVSGPRGSYVVNAPVLKAWTAAGGATGTYGLPTGPATVSGKTVVQPFEKGTITTTS